MGDGLCGQGTSTIACLPQRPPHDQADMPGSTHITRLRPGHRRASPGRSGLVTERRRVALTMHASSCEKPTSAMTITRQLVPRDRPDASGWPSPPGHGGRCAGTGAARCRCPEEHRCLVGPGASRRDPRPQPGQCPVRHPGPPPGGWVTAGEPGPVVLFRRQSPMIGPGSAQRHPVSPAVLDNIGPAADSPE